MGIYKKGNVYWMIKQYNGKKVERTLDTGIKRVAEERYSKIVSEIVGGSYFQKPKEFTISYLMEKYAEDRAMTKASNTLARDRSLREHITNYFGSYLLAEVTPEMVSDYRRKRYAEKKTVATVNRELAFLRNAYNIAIRHYKWCFVNPVSSVKFDRERNQRDRWLTSEDEKNLFSHLKGRLVDIVSLVLNTGLRQDEVLSLIRSNVDLFRKTITVKGKGDKVRTIPLNAVALDILKARMKTHHIHSELVFPSATGTKIMRQRLVRAFTKAAKDSGLQDFHFHDLRHTFATRLAQAGVDLYKIAKLLGHNDVSTTQRYAHHCPESLRSSVDVLTEYYNSTTVRSNAEEGPVHASA
ncbi:MAG: site-specific integrase [Nitrospirota bacterium]